VVGIIVGVNVNVGDGVLAGRWGLVVTAVRGISVVLESEQLLNTIGETARRIATLWKNIRVDNIVCSLYRK